MKILIFIVLFILLILYLIAPSKAKNYSFKKREYAHRGLFSKDQSIPENSLAAFKKAKENNYGIELDLQLSKDGEVVVFHDDSLNRMCHKNKLVKDLDLKQLRKLHLKESEEEIPLFTEVLKEIDGSVPLIVELKSCDEYIELCEKSYDLLKEYKGEYVVESFDPRILKWFYQNHKEIVRGQLSSQYSDFKGSGSSAIKSYFLSRCLLNFASRPNFIAYRVGKRSILIDLIIKMGAVEVLWTTHNKQDESNAPVIIFEHYKP